jgi:hypothetical protein
MFGNYLERNMSVTVFIKLFSAVKRQNVHISVWAEYFNKVNTEEAVNFLTRKPFI